MSDEHRVKIANSNILKYLIDHAEGTRDMGATQVAAATTLLRKVLPDLTSVDASLSGKVQIEKVIREIVDPAPHTDREEV